MKSEEQKQKDRECQQRYSTRKRAEGQAPMILPCKHCGKDAATKEYKKRHYERLGGITCPSCLKERRTEGVRTMYASMSETEKTDRSRHARSFVKMSGAEMVQKQWETIRANPELYAKRVASTSKATKLIWDSISEEEKNKRIQRLAVFNGRSKGSEKLKSMLIEAGVYDGFVSEEPFCGFIPDEINHELKIIIEYFGDHYHCNPAKFIDKSVYVKEIERTVGEQQKRDERRLGCFYNKGYTVLIVWESDFSKHPKAELDRLISSIQTSKKRGQY